MAVSAFKRPKKPQGWVRNYVDRGSVNKMKKCIDKDSPPSPGRDLLNAYITCINVCAFARNSFKNILWYFFRDSYQSIWLINLFTTTSYSIMFLCGCLTGYLLHKNSVLHSSLAVALGVIFTYLVSGVSSDECIYIFKGAMAGLFLGGMGGGSMIILRKFLNDK
ncbi:hypothetical protein [Yokenella regensburgei]|uniref:hypothetical protein n=1 Tax=Yokenella regensburgei TaxID=158877 RepID=UPI001FE76AD8|nr:hypothetical protein [Yokenella regensburgei]